jgi:viologen exporter family transport system permease protein
MLTTYVAQITAAIRMAFADRANFLLQMAGMAVNNGFFFLLWILFFAGFRSVGGWQLADVSLLLGVIMTVVGVAGVFFGGYRDLAAAILRGDADALLTQPKPVLARLLAGESLAHAWGDIVTGVALLATLAGLDATRVPLAVLGVALGLSVYVSASITFASLAFMISGARSFSRELTDFMLLLSSYPGSIYSGTTKLIAFTILPAGFVVLAPVEFLREPTLAHLGIAVAAAVGYAAVAICVFHLGLKRYQRGGTPTGG